MVYSWLTALSSLLLAGASLASPTSSPRIVHDKRVPSTQWLKHRRLDERAVLPVKIGLRQSNLDQLESLLYSISDPASPSYGQHWAPHEVASHFAPSEDSIQAVSEWLVEHGFGSDRVKLSKTKAFLSFEATVPEAELLLDTEFHVYKHRIHGTENIGCDHYTVPSHLAEHIDVITPTVNIARQTIANPASLKKRGLSAQRNTALVSRPKTNDVQLAAKDLPTDVTNCDQSITLDCLRALYQIDYTPVATDINTFAVVEISPDNFVQADLDQFFNQFSPAIAGTSPILVSIDGGLPTPGAVIDLNNNIQADSDLEITMGLTAPQQVQLYQVGEGGSDNNYLDALDGSYCTFEGGDDPNIDGIYPDPSPGGFEGPESCGIAKPANVIVVSHTEDESDFPAAYEQRQCTEYGKLGMMGVSIVYTSGNNGVGSATGQCLLPDSNDSSVNGTRFNPAFPVGCPFVTVVGATQVSLSNTVSDPEVASQVQVTSGGGFSNVFTIPSYQVPAVNNWFQNYPPPFTGQQFNNSRQARAYPDVSANGVNFASVVGGKFTTLFGTSGPIFASVLTLINDARLAIGKNPVGFINPAIYSPFFVGAFNDITDGNNPGCGTPGFSAAPGWDPVTGLGTPNFQELVTRWLTLP